MRRAGGQHPRRRAADASADRRNRERDLSRARNTSTSAPTRCCSRSASTNSRPASIFRFQSTWTAQREHHDFSVCREGTYDKAVKEFAWRSSAASASPPTPRCSTAPIPQSVRQFFDDMMELGVEGMMLSPGYTYDKAPDQEHFLTRKKTRNLFRQILSNRSEKWRFNLSPLVPRIPDGQAPITNARRGACRPTTSSAGRSPATCCRTATPTRSTSCMRETNWDELRHRERQSQVRELHGPQRL